MAKVLLFHHALGLTPGTTHFADKLRSAGHEVTTPDLFEGRKFESISDGVGYSQEIGFGTVMQRGREAAEALDPDLVYIGFSLGVVSAQMLAQTRPGAKGAVLCYSCIPASEFGGWPDGVPAQIHGMDHDPFFVDEGDLEAAQDLASKVESAELFLYEGDQHYFADDTQPSYRPEAAELLTQRVLELLGRVS